MRNIFHTSFIRSKLVVQLNSTLTFAKDYISPTCDANVWAARKCLRGQNLIATRVVPQQGPQIVDSIVDDHVWPQLRLANTHTHTNTLRNLYSSTLKWYQVHVPYIIYRNTIKAGCCVASHKTPPPLVEQTLSLYKCKCMIAIAAVCATYNCQIGRSDSSGPVFFATSAREKKGSSSKMTPRR